MPGSKKLTQVYGDKLLLVRYRYDPELDIRLKTVEIIVERKPVKENVFIPSNKMVFVRVEFGEVDIGVKLKKAGGCWDKDKKLWRVPYQKVKKLGMLDRIVMPERPK